MACVAGAIDTHISRQSQITTKVTGDINVGHTNVSVGPRFETETSAR